MKPIPHTNPDSHKFSGMIEDLQDEVNHLRRDHQKVVGVLASLDTLVQELKRRVK